MKFAVLSFGVLSVLSFSGCATSPAHFVERGMFNPTPFVSARAKTPDEAKRLAMAAIPKNYEIDQYFPAPVLSCADPEESISTGTGPVPEGPQCASGIFRVDMALLPKAGREREVILEHRAAERAALPNSNGEM